MIEPEPLIQLNVGASPIWSRDGWTTLDHKARRTETGRYIVGDAANIPLDDDTCSTIFSGHMIEHVPHTKLEAILSEFNRVLTDDGILRLVSPDLRKIASAYVNNDKAFFDELLREDENVRTDLGMGGMMMNCVVSPGQDTALFNRQLTEFIAGYAHLYLYDCAMLTILLDKCGFYDIKECGFLESSLVEYQVPLHVRGFDGEYHNLNQDYYAKHGLVHYYDDATGQYNINFELTGFDRDPTSSLFIEARKKSDPSKKREPGHNYNRYGGSLMMDPIFAQKVNLVNKLATTLDNEVESSLES